MRPRVVIVGGGFGGLAAVQGLRDADVELTLVDRHNHHVFTPLIYQVATAMLEPSEIANPLRSVLRRLPHADFRLGVVTRIDLEKREVLTSAGTLPYDYLVLAAGSTNNYFKHPEIASDSFGINDVGEAVALRNHMLECFECAAWQDDPAERRRLLTFVIVGGGPTGVEFAGSLAEMVSGILPRDCPWLDPREVTINLIEASDLPLPPFQARLQKSAAAALTKRGVSITSGLVETVDVAPGTSQALPALTVRTADGSQIPCATVVWAAGVRAQPLGEQVGGQLASQGRVPVRETLQLADHPEVLAVGDMAEIKQDGQVLPMLAPVAMRSGAHAARVIKDLIAARTPQPFVYRALPTMATIGRGDAVVQGKRVGIGGMPGWILWLAVHIARIAGLRARLTVAVDWTSAFVLRDRPVRLIIKPRRPDVDR